MTGVSKCKKTFPADIITAYALYTVSPHFVSTAFLAVPLSPITL